MSSTAAAAATSRQRERKASAVAQQNGIAIAVQPESSCPLWKEPIRRSWLRSPGVWL